MALVGGLCPPEPPKWGDIVVDGGQFYLILHRRVV